MSDITKTYTNGEITVVWQPAKCIHSALCVRGLPEVFDTKARPWINAQGAATDRIVAQIKQCPSGALTYHQNETQEAETTSETVVEAMPNGPLLIYGTLVVKDRTGQETRKTKTTAFCRCGASANKPYCDGAHARIGFKDE